MQRGVYPVPAADYQDGWQHHDSLQRPAHGGQPHMRLGGRPERRAHPGQPGLLLLVHEQPAAGGYGEGLICWCAAQPGGFKGAQPCAQTHDTLPTPAVLAPKPSHPGLRPLRMQAQNNSFAAGRTGPVWWYEVSTFGPAVTRGSLDCDLLHSWLQPPGSASCMRLSGSTYQVRPAPR